MNRNAIRRAGSVSARSKSSHARFRHAFSLTELMAALAIVGLAATLVVYATSARSLAAKKAACESIKGDIELQCELWRHNSGSWPATNLSDISASVHYFPTGVPTCPYNGTSYTITTSGRVSGHNH